MQIEIKIDESVREPKVIIVTEKMTDEIRELISRLGTEHPKMLLGYKGEIAEILAEEDIIRIYAMSGKIFCETRSGEYSLRGRLYEWEDRLSERFVRISNSEIVNLKMVKAFDMSFTGTVAVRLKNGKSTYISRRYISKVKEALGI